MKLKVCALVLLAVGCQMKEKDVGRAAAKRAMPDDTTYMKLLAFGQVEAKSATPIVVKSSVFNAGGPIPYKYSDWGEKISPPLTWNNLPSGTKAIAILCEDPDAALPKPFIHWVAYNLPVMNGIREAVPGSPRLMQFDGAYQGKNSRGATGYMGPHPPVGDPPHHYHFQVFALDDYLQLNANLDRGTVVNALKGHVLAKGLLIGTYQSK